MFLQCEMRQADKQTQSPPTKHPQPLFDFPDGFDTIAKLERKSDVNM